MTPRIAYIGGVSRTFESPQTYPNKPIFDNFASFPHENGLQNTLAHPCTQLIFSMIVHFMNIYSV